MGQPPLGQQPIEFFITLTPSPKGNSQSLVRNKATGATFLVGNQKAKKKEKELRALVQEHAPEKPFDCCITLDVQFVMPIPAGFPKWKREAALRGAVSPGKRPDRGNLLKLVEDALEGAFYTDDARIVGGNVAKVYGEVPGYRIRLTPRSEPQTATDWAACLAFDGGWVA